MRTKRPEFVRFPAPSRAQSAALESPAVRACELGLGDETQACREREASTGELRALTFDLDQARQWVVRSGIDQKKPSHPASRGLGWGQVFA